MRKWALIEQASLSLTSFSAALFFARTFSSSEWATYSLGLALVLFAQGFQRATVLLPLITQTTHDPELKQSIKYWVRQNWKILIISCACLLLTAALWQKFMAEKWIANAFTVAAILTTGFFYHEFWRRALIQCGKIRICAFAALTHACLTALSVSILSATDAKLYMWPVAMGLCSFATGWLLKFNLKQPDTPQNAEPYSAPPENHFGTWATLSHIAYSSYSTGIQLLLSYIAGPNAMGIFSAVRNIIQPINSIIGAIDSLDKPKAARAYASGGYNALFFSLRQTATALGLLGGLYLLLSASFGGFIIQWIYKGSYGMPWLEVWLWCGVALSMMIAQPTESGLYVANKPAALFYNRLVSAAVGLTIAMFLIPAMGAVGALIALTGSWISSGALAIHQLKRFASAEVRKQPCS